MNFTKNARILLLNLTLIGLFLVLVKSIFYPTTVDRKITTFNFPSVVPLTGWQPLPSNNLIELTTNQPNYVSGRQYQYIQNGIPIDIEMRYLVNTAGDVKDLVKTYKLVPTTSITLRQHNEIGFYGLFTYQGKAYLSTCINPHGGSTFTDRQFKQNRNIHDWQTNRILPWLLGRENLKDNRCLWANLSTDIKNSSPESAYYLLETTFPTWYQWWYQRFPQA